MDRFRLLVEFVKHLTVEEVRGKINQSLRESGSDATVYSLGIHYHSIDSQTVCPAWLLWFTVDPLITECVDIETLDRLKADRRKSIIEALQESKFNLLDYEYNWV